MKHHMAYYQIICFLKIPEYQCFFTVSPEKSQCKRLFGYNFRNYILPKIGYFVSLDIVTSMHLESCIISFCTFIFGSSQKELEFKLIVP